jgi:hypothetical protein
MSEKNLRHKVRDALKPAHVIQVENGMCDGTPDTYASFPEWLGWIELKYATTIPKRRATAVFKSINRGLETEQAVWLHRGWVSHKGSTWVLVEIEGIGYYLVPGCKAFEFNEMTLAQLEVYSIPLKFIKEHLIKGSVDFLKHQL